MARLLDSLLKENMASKAALICKMLTYFSITLRRLHAIKIMRDKHTSSSEPEDIESAVPGQLPDGCTECIRAC